MAKIVINKRTMDEYFGYETLRMQARSPLVVTENLGKYDVFVNVKGGGYTGQAGAVRHGYRTCAPQSGPGASPDTEKSGILNKRLAHEGKKKNMASKPHVVRRSSQRDNEFGFEKRPIWGVFLIKDFTINKIHMLLI